MNFSLRRTAVATLMAALALTVPACTPTAPAETEAPNGPTGWELNKQGAAGRIKAAGLTVLKAEGHAEHFHAHLDVFVDGKAMIVPADIGLEFNGAGKPTGISALHTHDETGIIHIEAPSAGDTYTLGQFLTEWGVLDTGDTRPGSAHSSFDGWTVAVNGTKQDSKPKDVVLKAHDQILLSYGKAPDPALPTSFAFPDGL